MKRKGYLGYFILFTAISLARQPQGVTIPDQIHNQRDQQDIDFAPRNINDMVYWIYKSTKGITSSPNGVQADFPKGTGGAIYKDGIVWGGMVNDGNEQSPRVGGTTYADGLKAGVVRYLSLNPI